MLTALVLTETYTVLVQLYDAQLTFYAEIYLMFALLWSLYYSAVFAIGISIDKNIITIEILTLF